LSFLTVKLLMRFRCVCKSWNALVSNPKFIKIHQKKSERNKNLVLIEKEYSSSRMYKSLMVNYLPISGLVGHSLITLANDHILMEEEEDGFFIVGSCNGLVCLVGYSDLERWLYFYNPATRKLSKKLGTFTVTDKYRDMFGFGYDTSTDTHKVVNLCETSRDARIFSLGDNIWRSIPSFPDVRILYEYLGYARVYLSGTLNWLVIRKDITYDLKNSTGENFVIISLDLGTETYTQLLPPQGCGEKLLVDPTICVFMDCLCTCFSHAEGNKGDQFVIWKMMKFGVEESWSQFLKISYQTLQRSCFNYPLLPLCLSESGDTLILGVRRTGQKILYNWRTNMVVKSAITVGKRWFYFNHYFESLVSTNGK
jgi:F-box interacting protein